MITNFVVGDLLSLFEQSIFDAIAHGCNCQHKMGAGIALQIKNTYPEAYFADKNTAIGSLKLGTYSLCETTTGIIFNLYTQEFPGKTDQKSLSYAIKDAFTNLNQQLKDKGQDFVLGIPKIGAGLASGDWEIHKEIINNCTPDFNICVVTLS
jgi:O-acetyl-ADP-ribose deacetylase (regulator of RNase III)